MELTYYLQRRIMHQFSRSLVSFPGTGEGQWKEYYPNVSSNNNNNKTQEKKNNNIETKQKVDDTAEL